MCQIETETSSEEGKELKIQRHKEEQETNKTDKNEERQRAGKAKNIGGKRQDLTERSSTFCNY